jgi:hypothetical protein
MGSESISPLLLNFDTRWRLVVISKPPLLYPQEESPTCPLSSTSGRAERFIEKKNFIFLPAIETDFWVSRA